MYTESEIVTSPDLSIRSYVKVYIDGERNRFYNGKDLGIRCNPNRAKSIPERDKALSFLCYELKKKLEKGWKPEIEANKPTQRVVIPASKAFTELKPKIEEEGLSDVYEHDLLAMTGHFLTCLKTNRLENLPVADINTNHVEQFLQQFKSSATNYMNRRRALSALFLRLKTQKLLGINPTQETGKMKEVPHLNLPYKKEQLRKVLQIVKERHEQLYLCCLLMYGCLLRLHQEIRLLKRGYFDESFNKISLGGNQNKSRRIRSVLVPEYVRTEIIRLNVPSLEEGMNIFSHTITAFWTNPAVVAVVNKQQHHLVINLVNEWGANYNTNQNNYSQADVSTFINTYKSAIAAIRNAGIKVPLMIDAYGFGDREDIFTSNSYGQGTSNGQYLINQDPLHNLLFDLHTYYWENNPQNNTPSVDPTPRLQGLVNSGLPFLIGEMGNILPDGSTTTGYADLLTKANNQGIGYLAWSWYNDGTTDQTGTAPYAMNMTINDKPQGDGVTLPSSSSQNSWGYNMLNGTGYGINTASPGTQKVGFPK